MHNFISLILNSIVDRTNAYLRTKAFGQIRELDLPVSLTHAKGLLDYGRATRTLATLLPLVLGPHIHEHLKDFRTPKEHLKCLELA